MYCKGIFLWNNIQNTKGYGIVRYSDGFYLKLIKMFKCIAFVWVIVNTILFKTNNPLLTIIANIEVIELQIGTWSAVTEKVQFRII